jgi:hypothetical protein
MSDKKFEWDGKTYAFVMSPHGWHCRGCAFQDDGEACDKASDHVHGGDCPAGSIWVEAAPQGTALADASGGKPTNPKDAIGIRKAPLSTLPMGVVAEMGAAMLEGAAKYGRHNYRGVGVRASVYFDATMRHLIGWWEGEDTDPDSGLSHVTKALVSLAVLRDAMMQSKCEDDRPPRSAPFYPELNDRCSAVLDKHADKNPKHWTIKDTL